MVETITSLELNILSSTDIIWINLKLNGMASRMELDTGSAVSVMADEVFHKKFGRQKFKKPDIILRTYSGEHIKPVGWVDVQVEYNDHELTLPLYVEKKEGPALFLVGIG
jgi:hypothetical protein